MFVKEVIEETFDSIWPLILIVLVMFTLVRLCKIFYTKEKFIFYKEVLSFIFVIYVLMLFYIVSAQDASYGGSNYIPFKEIFRFELFSDGFNRNTLGNIVLFIPFGFYICHYIKDTKFLPVFISSLLGSLTIEFMQRYIGRTFDIDDIILNVTGALIGLFIYLVLDVTRKKLPRMFSSEIFLNILIIVVLFLVFYFYFDFLKGFSL